MVLLSGKGAASCVAGLLSRKSDWSEQIQVDAPKTVLQQTSFTEDHEQSYLRVLNAYAFLHPDVGYSAGMGNVVRLLLFVSGCSEQETLFVLVRLMQDCRLGGFYREGSPLLEHYMRTFDELMTELLPDLRCHFTSEGVQSTDYVQNWLLSLFIDCLPLETVLILWDIVMCNGLPHLVLAAIALLSSVKQVLLTKNCGEILQFFGSMKRTDDEPTAIKAGHYISGEIGRFRKMPCVQKQLAKMEDHMRNLDLASQEEPLKPSPKKGRRVSFKLEPSDVLKLEPVEEASFKLEQVSSVEDGNSIISWYLF